MASDRRDDSKLREVSADSIDYRGLLADEQVPGSMQCQATLLLWRLGCDEPHVRPGDRFADCLGVSSIVLVPLHIGLHIGRWHQAYGMAKRLELARPMMRRGASFNTDQAWWELLKECQYVAPLELTADNDVALRIDAMNLKDRLRDVETDCCNRLHGWLLRIVGALTALTSMALTCRVEEPSTASLADMAGLVFDVGFTPKKRTSIR